MQSNAGTKTMSLTRYIGRCEMPRVSIYFLWAFLPVFPLLLGMSLWYVAPLADAILLCGLILTFLALLFGIGALFKRRWVMAGFRLVPLIVFCVIIAISKSPISLPRLGFYANTLLNPSSIKSCSRASRDPRSGQARIALCDMVPRVMSDETTYIIYDSFNELSLPHNLRDENWKSLAKNLPNGYSIAEFPHPAIKLFGSFYAIVITMQDADRS